MLDFACTGNLRALAAPVHVQGSNDLVKCTRVWMSQLQTLTVLFKVSTRRERTFVVVLHRRSTVLHRHCTVRAFRFSRLGMTMTVTVMRHPVFRRYRNEHALL